MAKVSDKNSCSICLNTFRNPKALSCLHTFCETCLDDYINNIAIFKVFHCPLCRKAYSVPEKGAKEFPTNFYVHDQLKDAEKGDKKEIKCETHTANVIDSYCSNCKTLMCAECISSDHYAHDVHKVKDVPTEAILKELQTSTNNLKCQLRKFETYLGCVKGIIKEIKSSAESYCNEVDQKVHNICEAAVKIGKEMKADIQKKCQDEEKRWTTLMDEAKIMLLQLETQIKYASTVSNEGCTIDIVNATKVADFQKLENDRRVLPAITNPRLVEFRSNDIDSLIFSDICLLGEVGYVEEEMFEHSFNINNVGCYWQNSPSETICAQLPFSIGLKVHKPSSSMYLSIILNRFEFGTKSCRGLFTLKLLNKKNDDKSLYNQFYDTFSPGHWREWDDGLSWSKIIDLENGFVNEDGIFTVQAKCSLMLSKF